MFGRALFWLLPAVLVLAFAQPAPSATAVYASAVERGADGCAVSLASIAFLPHDRTFGFSQWTEPDDDDRMVHATAVVVWTPITTSVPFCRTSDILGCTYPTSAAFPRGPPSA